MKKLILIVVILISPILLFAQKCIKLTNRKTGQESFLYEGMRVGYLQKRHLFIQTGTIKHITDTTIQVGHNQFRRWSLKQIGPRKFGTNGLSILLAGISGFLLPLFSSPEKTTRSISEIGAISLIGISAYIDVHNLPKNVVNTWKLEIVELR